MTQRFTKTSKKSCIVALIALATVFSCPLLAYDKTGISTKREYRIKAAYLYNLSKFITWPAHVKEQDDDILTICVVDGNPFGEYLNRLQAKKVHGKTLDIQYLPKLDDQHHCHIAFVAANNTIDTSKNSHMLTVGNDLSFIAKGGDD